MARKPKTPNNALRELGPLPVRCGRTFLAVSSALRGSSAYNLIGLYCKNGQSLLPPSVSCVVPLVGPGGMSCVPLLGSA